MTLFTDSIFLGGKREGGSKKKEGAGRMVWNYLFVNRYKEAIDLRVFRPLPRSS